MKKIKVLLFCLFLSFCLPAFAAPSPMAMLQSTSNQMLSALQNNKAVLKTNPEFVYSMVRRILLPHIDTTSMAHAVLSRDAWMNATPAQRQQFTQQFTTLLIHTYSAAFAAYSDESVQFLPMRGNASGQSDVQIDSQIIRHNGGPPISVTYRLILEGQSWKVYDFSVDGVSMIQSFRSQFASQLSQGNLDALIRQLVQHNAQPQG